MEKKTILIATAAFIAGILLSGGVARYAVNGNHAGMMNMYAMHTNATEKSANSSAAGVSMEDMMTGLQGKRGDAFDKAFIAEMIVHHQGAIDMANLAKTNAQHQEIKDLASGIVTAQTSEINEMKNWQSEWGYSSSSSMMNGHEMKGM